MGVGVGVGVRAVAVGAVAIVLGAVAVSPVLAEPRRPPPVPQVWTGHFSIDKMCSGALCNKATTTESLDLVQIGKRIVGTITGEDRVAVGVVGTAAGAQAGAPTGTAARASLQTADGHLNLQQQADKSLTGTFQGDDGSSSDVVGASGLPPFAFGGRWVGSSTCIPPFCGVGDDTLRGVFDLTQTGDAISGTVTDTDDGVTSAGSGTASGSAAGSALSATLRFPGDPISAVYDVTMSADGRSFTATQTVTENSTGFSHTIATVTATRDVEPSLTVAVSANVPQAGLGLRKMTDVTVLVSAVGGTVDGISLGSGLGVSPELEVTASPSDASGFSLTDGQSKTLTYTVKGAKAGPATATATATGTDGGATITGTGSAPIKVGGPVLQITVTGTPACISTAGRSQEVAVKVTVRNVGEQLAENVKIISMTAVPVDHTQALEKLRFDPNYFPFVNPTGAIEPNGKWATTLRLPAGTGNGAYEVEALGLFDDPSAAGGNGRLFAVGAPFEVVSGKCAKTS